ncbi:MAG: hypothetical protein Q7S39_04180 [Ignavibacteria bacterium]|nr:hypothetical protein [Ignavibacteria bacterium]
MGFKRFFIVAFFLSAVLLSFSVVSADNFQDFLNSSSEVTVTVTQESSQVDFDLNTEGKGFDEQHITLGNLNVTLFIQEFLDGLSWDAQFNSGSTPHFNSLDISGSSTTTVIDFLLTDVNAGFNVAAINNDVDVFNDYLDVNALVYETDSNVHFTKLGTHYTIENDEGYGEATIEEIVNGSVASMSVPVLLNEFFSLITPSDLDNSLTSLGLDLNELDYTVDFVNLNSVSLQDGTYTVPVVLRSGDGNTYTKNVNLVLQGIKNEEKNVPVAGTYNPTKEGVKAYINSVSGIGNNVISVSLLDAFSSTLPLNLNALKYMEISVSTPTDGVIEFKVPTSDVSNPSLVHLYVLEGGNWIRLPTIFLNTAGGFYEYRATTLHFSTFMIGEETSTTTSGSGSSRRSTTTQQPAQTPTAQTPSEPPIEAAPAAPTSGFFAGITGAFIGALGTGGSMVVILFIVSIVAVLVILKVTRAGERQKKGKLNEKGGENDK